MRCSLRAVYLLVWLSLSIVGLAGCSDPSDSDDDSSSSSCQNVCTLGETRCSGTVIEGCAVSPDGCTAWITGIDCQNSDALCDDSSEPAQCQAQGTSTPGTQGSPTPGPGVSPTPDPGASPTPEPTDAPLCNDHKVDGDETDVDCGGSCKACPVGDTCQSNEDCDTNRCDLSDTHTCLALDAETCDDHVKNQDESDVDCGGLHCSACATGKACDSAADCASKNCDIGQSDQCVSASTPSCGDGVKNQDETGTDCGGSSCGACGNGQECSSSLDCKSGNCDVGVTNQCISSSIASCGDGLKNQDETGVDCGGSICGACANGEGCSAASDCTSGNCDIFGSNLCVSASTVTCVDGKKNGNETDIDCGGDKCDDCSTGEACKANADCDSSACDVGVTNKCVLAGTPTCADGKKNQDESDIDCGGDRCNACATGQTCLEGADCASSNCDVFGTNKCVSASTPTCGDNKRNGTETDVDCGGDKCGDCGIGQACALNSDCATATCDVGGTDQCVAAGTPTCADGKKNGNETDFDCGGSKCEACDLGGSCLNSADCSTGNCDVGVTNQCVSSSTPTCSDGKKNGGETDIDCGGGTCGACQASEACHYNSDCQSGYCDYLNTQTCKDVTPSYQVNEDFETGDFRKFPYTFKSAGAATTDNWSIETSSTACHAGSYCMRTNPAHASGETTSVSVSLSIRQDTQITFWAKLNTEPDQYIFNFYVDGVLQTSKSGQIDWALYSFPVKATGANGANRVFTWEYVRSSYMPPGHVPYNQIWVDDIDMPAWNTDPTVPQIIRPGNGKLTTDNTPTFEWRSDDPDLDPITYKMQFDKDPAFSNPVTSGETNDVTFTPSAALADGVYYWRVQAKDNSDFRWSAWSTASAVEINQHYEYAAVWRQTDEAEFLMDSVSNLTVGTSKVSNNNTASYNSTQAYQLIAFNGGTNTFNFTGLPTAAPGTPATVTVTATGDFDSSSSEYASVSLEGLSLGTFVPASCNSYSKSYPISDVSSYVSDGATKVSFTTTANVDNGGCSSGQTYNQVQVSLKFSSSGADGTLTSVVVNFDLFEGKMYWEKVQSIGTGTIKLQVLDESGALIPDQYIPNNSKGFTTRTVRLWDLDPDLYPAIRLKATLSAGASLDEWTVVGNDVFEWLFSNQDDLEGWVGSDHNATPTVVVANGALKLSSGASGDDPNIQYWFPQSVDAERFTVLEVRVRTSNNYINDDPALYWYSNYGEFDNRRSFVIPAEYLYEFQNLPYDLTYIPGAPSEPWQGDIQAIRLDPVVRFVDQLGNPASGWFEIDRIAIY